MAMQMLPMLVSSLDRYFGGGSGHIIGMLGEMSAMRLKRCSRRVGSGEGR